MTEDRFRVGALVMVLLAFVAVGAYYTEVLHKPFGPRNLAAIFSVALDLLIVGGLAIMALAIGEHALRSLVDLKPLERVVFGVGLGFGLLGFVMLILGALALYWRTVLWTLFVIGVLLAARRVSGVLQGAREAGLELPAGRLYPFITIYLGARLFLGAIDALMPPTAWDSLCYHLTGPKLFMQAHRLASGIDIPNLGYSSLLEMLYTAALLLKGPAVAQLIHWLYAPMTLALIYAFARHYFEPRVGWLAMGLFFSVPSIVWLYSWAYADGAIMFYGLAALYAGLRWSDSRRSVWLVLSGAFAGLAMSVKFTGVVLAAALIVALIADRREEGLRMVGSHALLLAGTAALVVAPFLIKNWTIFGNPVYPFVFDGYHWDTFRHLWFARPGTGLIYTAPWRLLTMPWEVAISGSEGKQLGASGSPLILVGLIVLAFSWRQLTGPEKRPATALLILSAVSYLAWLYGAAESVHLQQTRLLFPIFPALALLGALGFAQLSALASTRFRVDWLLNAVLVLVLGLELTGAAIASARVQPTAYLTGWETHDAYLRRMLESHFNAMHYINQNLTADARIYFWWEARSYYCERACRPDTLLDNFPYLAHRYRTAAAMAEGLKAEGYTHVLLYKKGMDYVLAEKMDPLSQQDTAVLNEMLESYLTPIYADGTEYVLYQLKQ